MTSEIYRGEITRVTSDGLFVEVNELGAGREFGPMQFLGTTTAWAAGMGVIVGSVSKYKEDLVILAEALNEVPDPPSSITVLDTATVDLTLAADVLSADVKPNSIPLNDLSDVIITTPATGHLLRYNGTNFVNSVVSIPSTLDDLSDVIITTPANGHVIQHNGTNWVNVAKTTLLALDDLSDVTSSGAATGRFLRKSGGDWTAQTATIDDLSDVVISSPTTGQLLRYDGSNWINVAPTAVGFPGEVKMWPSKTPPADWLAMDGSSQTRATYPDLFDVVCRPVGNFAVTIASPGVITLVSHGLVGGDRVFFTTTGALPTGLSANTMYYVLAASLTSTTFRVSLTDAGAAINTTGSQSGTHSLRQAPWGIASSTTFNLPSMVGRSPFGYDNTDINTTLGRTGGTKTHTLVATELPNHVHGWNGAGSATPTDTNDQPARGPGAGDANFRMQAELYSSETYASGAITNGQPHNNQSPFGTINFIIKT